jgi:hypothetical protein
LPESVISLTSVSCPVAGSCFLLAGADYTPELLTTTNGGTTWDEDSIPTSAGLDAMTCPSATECIVVGAGIAMVTNSDGSSWTHPTIPSNAYELSSVSCSTPSECVAVGYTNSSPYGQLIIGTTSPTTTWSDESAPPPATGSGQLLSDVTCPSVTVCIAVSGSNISSSSWVIRTVDGGATWTKQTVPRKTANVIGVSCGSKQDCVAVGLTDRYVPRLLVTTNAGGTWISEKAPAGVTQPNAVDCAVQLQCTSLWRAGASDDIVGDLHVTSISLPQGTVGEEYNALLTSLGGTAPDSWSVTHGSLPKGLTLNATTGGLSGTPTKPSEGTPTFTVTDAIGDTASFAVPLNIESQ